MKIKLLNKKAKVPTFGSAGAAGCDLYACLDTPVVTIQPHDTVKIKTGIAIEIPLGYFGAIFARSGLATKHGLRPANAVGVVDRDFRGELIVALHNDSRFPSTICDGERIAQLVIMPYYKPEFEIVEELSETERGEGGFGSTGMN